MKTKISISALLIIFFSLSTLAQNLVVHDNIYFDQDGNPFTGKYKEYYASGSVKLEMDLNKGMKNGNVIMYFENGKIHEVYAYKQNLMDGLWLTFNEKNIKTAEANYLNDKKDGTWKIWDENGMLVYEMQYKNGEKAGNWIKYNGKGEEIARKSYIVN